MMSIYLEKRDPARRQWRFYRIVVCPTLFGPWAMVREWGRIGSPGTVRETWHDSEEEALEAGERFLKQKTKRGYRRR
ncbi:MAG: WGR domain-containing protein [Pseudomonadota bacterium]|nr:WGR domain-containing protein [Pseudomonadota bacterium]